MRKIFLLCCALLCIAISNAQVTGTKTIGVDYPTLAAAVTALNTTGVGAGGATINVPAGYTETAPSGGFVLGTAVLNASLSTTSPLLFQKSGAGANPVLTAFTAGTSTTSDGVFKLAGTDYVSIDGINIVENAANTGAAFMEWGYALVNLNAVAPFDGCQNVTIKNCSVTLDRTNPNGAFGIYSAHNIATNNTALTITAAGDLHSNNKFYSNTISNVNEGFWILGFAAASPYTLYDQNNDVGGTSAATGNTVKTMGVTALFNTFCVYLVNQNAVNASYNSIDNNAGGPVTSTTQLIGIYVGGTTNSATVNNNSVTLTETGGTAIVGAIYGANTGNFTANNNTVSFADAAGSGTHYGILTSSATTVSINTNSAAASTSGAVTASYYCIYNSGSPALANITSNTISNFNTSTTGTTAGIYNAGAPTVYNVNSNNFSAIVRTGASGTHYCIYTGSPATGTFNANTADGISFTTITSTGTIYGIYDISSGITMNYTNNVIKNFSTPTTGTLYGIREFGSAGNKTIQNNTVSNFSTTTGGVGGTSMTGISWLTGGTTDDISGNKVFSLNSTGTTGGTGGTIIGMLCSGGTTNNIYKNKVYDLSSTSTGVTLWGMQVSGGTTNNVYNNYVGDLRTPALNAAINLAGIYFSAGTTDNAYFNTVYLAATSTGAVFGSAAMYASTTPSVTLKNNIFVNLSTSVGATGFTTAYRRSSTTLTTYQAVSNNNLFYAGTPGANNLIHYDGTNSFQTLAAYKAMTVPGTLSPRDNVSITENPTFVSIVGSNAGFLHINTTVATQVESAGGAITGITDDYDGDVRNVNTPDIGADEGNFVALDLTGPSINYTPLTATLCTTARTISATIVDASGVNVAAGTKPRIWFKKASNANVLPGTNTNSTDGWKYAEASNGANPFSLTIDPAIIFGGIAGGDVIQYFVVAQDNAATPNVSINSGTFAIAATSVALSAANFPIGGSINSYAIPSGGLSGTVTIGAAGTYTSITGSGGLFAAINASGLTGNLTVNILDAAVAESGANALNTMVYGCAGPYSLTIKPGAGVNTTLTGSAGFIFKLNGASNVTIDGSNNGTATQNLTIVNNQATTSAVIWNASVGGTGNGANNNTFKNLIITGGSGSVSTVIGIANAATSSITTAGDENNNLIIQNCSISKVLIGIEALGSTGLPQNGLVINGNSIGSVTAANYIQFQGIQLSGAVNPIVSLNSIFNIKTSTLTTAATGIDFGANVIGGQLVRNNITGVYNQNTGQWPAYGINFSSTTGTTNVLVANNFISDIQTVIYTSSTTYNAFGIRLTGGTNLKVYNNSVNLYGNITLASGTGFSSDVLVTSTSVTGLDLRNNILVNNMTFAATASVYNVYLPSGFSFTSNNNDYSGASGAGPTTYFVGYNGIASQSTLANWQAAYGQDGLSQSTAPVFISATDLHLVTTPIGTNWCLNSSAASIPAVTIDIDGDPRNATTPDMGADEFNPAGDGVATPASQTVCSGAPLTPVTYTGTAVSYSWTRDNAATVTGLPASGTGSITGSLVNTSNVPVTVTFTISPLNASGCAGLSFTSTVLVYPSAVAIASPASQTACTTSPITTILLSSATTGATYTWTRDNTATVTGMAASGNGNISGSLTNTTAAPVTVTFTITASANGCAGVTTSTATVTVNPGAIITPTFVQPTTCVSADGSIILAVGGAAGPYTFAWTGTGVNATAQNQTGLTAGSYTVTVTSGNGCSVTTVLGLSGPGGCGVCPTVGSVATNPSPSGCIGSTVTFTASGLASMGVSYGIAFKSFTAATADPYTGGTVLATVPNSALTAGGTLATGNGTFATANTYYVYAILSPTPVDPTCRPSAVTNFIVNPAATATATPASQTTCSGAAITTIALSGTVAGTTYSWTRNNTATVTGIAASGNGNISGTLTNNTGAAITVTFTITPTANGCAGTPTTATVLVNPTTTGVATPASQTTCSAANITTINLTGVTGTTFTWTRDNTASVVGGIAASGSGSSITGFLTNITTAPVTVTFTITPTANGCVGTPVTATVIVNPFASAVATPVAQTVCSGSPITTIALTGNVTGTTYSWTRDNTAGLTGIAASGTGNISGTLINAGTAAGITTFTITPSFGGCAGPSITASITVNALPVVTQPANQTLCNGTATAAITFASTLTGTTYSWTNSTTSIGLAASGTGNIASFNAINTGTTPVVATITVTPTAGACPGTAKTFTITVNPTATVNAIATNQVLCTGATTTAVTFSGAVTGTTYNWTNNTPSIGLAASGTGNIAAFTAVNATSTAVTATITVTPTVNGCAGTSTSFTITVNGQSVAPTGATASTGVFCGTGTTNLSVSGGALGTGASWKWYTGSCGGTLIGTGTTIAVTVTATSTYYVRAEGTCNTTTCASVSVTVNQQPTITLTASPYTSLTPFLTTGITATTNPPLSTTGTSIIWYKDGVVVNGVVTNTLTGITVDKLGTYTARVTTAAGCTALSAPVVIRDSSSDKLYVMPNPTNGQFKLRYYSSTPNFGFLRMVTIYDGKGSKVYSKGIPVTSAYSLMDIDIRSSGKGVYFVVVADYNGNKLAQTRVVVQ